MNTAKKLQVVGSTTDIALPPLNTASIADRINRALTEKPPSSRDVATLLSDARAERLRLDAHRTTLEREALDPTRSQADATRMYDDAARMNFDGKRIDAGLERLEELRLVVLANEKRLEREAVYWTVRRERDLVAKGRDERLKKLTTELAGLVTRLYDVDSKIYAANAGVPSGENPIADLISSSFVPRGEQLNLLGSSRLSGTYSSEGEFFERVISVLQEVCA